jgi:beta-glucosidase
MKINLIILISGILLTFCSSEGTYYEEDNNEIPVPEVSPDDPCIKPLPREDSLNTGRIDQNGNGTWINYSWMEIHNYFLSNIELNADIIFIGDSITDWWEGPEGFESWNRIKAKYNRVVNYGVAGDTTQNVLWRLNNGEFPAGMSPKWVMILIGTNNIGSAQAESIAAGIGEITKQIYANAPRTKIILFSILPRGSGSIDFNSQWIKIDKVNSLIKKYCGFLNIQYFDIGKYFIDKNGNIIDDLYTDGLHLSKKGYKIWEEIIYKIAEGRI